MKITTPEIEALPPLPDTTIVLTPREAFILKTLIGHSHIENTAEVVVRNAKDNQPDLTDRLGLTEEHVRTFIHHMFDGLLTGQRGWRGRP